MRLIHHILFLGGVGLGMAASAAFWIFISTGTASAQVAIDENGVAQLAIEADEETAFNIDTAIAELLSEFCMPIMGDTEATLDDCPMPTEPAVDLTDAISQSRIMAMAALVSARTEALRAEAEILVLTKQLQAEELRGQLQELQLENGIVVPADELAEALSEIMRLEDELAMTNDYAAELHARIEALENKSADN